MSTTTDLAPPGPGDPASEADTNRSNQEPATTSENGDGPPPPRTRRFVIGLGGIAVVGLAIRLLYVLIWKNPGPEYGDALYYHHGANLLADGHGYTHPLQWLFEGRLDIPGADHPPGYLTVLAAFSLLGMKSFLAHQLVSCVLGTLGVVVMGFAGRRIAGERVGLFTAGIVAASPNVWFHDALVMSETLVVATTAAILWTAYRWWDRPTLANAAIFGASVGVGGIVRGEALLLGLVIGLPLVVWRRPETGSGTATRDRALQLGLAGVVIAVLLAPWTLYNLSRFEHPVPVSAQFDHTLVAANCDDVYYGPNTGYWSRNCVIAVEPRTDPDDDASEEAVVFREIAGDYIGDNTARLPWVLGARVLRTFGLYQPQNQVSLDFAADSKELGLGQAGLLVWYVVALAGVAGLVGLRRAGRPIFPIVAVVGATVLTVLVTYGATRFRFPAELALCIPAAVSLDAVVAAVQRRRAARSDTDDDTAEAATEAPDGDPSGSTGTTSPAAGDDTTEDRHGVESGGTTWPTDDDAAVEQQGAEATADGDGTTDTALGEAAGSGASSDTVAPASTDVPGGLGSSGGRFAGFDGLRAIAAFGVLLTHVALASGLVGRSDTGRFLSRADVGVALFFVLSGFLLYRPFVSRRLDGAPGPGVRRYLRHRFLRIFPAYWLALTVLGVVLDVRNADQFHTVWDFVVYYGLLQSYSETTALGGLQQAWTLTNEVAFYLLLPLLAAGFAALWQRLRPKQALLAEIGILAAAAAAALGFRFWLHSVQDVDPRDISTFDPRFHWILANFQLFVPGMVLALLYEWSRRRDEPLRALELVRRHPLACWGVAAVAFWAVSTQIGLELLVGADNRTQDLKHQMLYATVGIALMAPVALAGAELPRSLRWLSTRVMVTLGMLSYGIYLWHEGITDIYREMRGLVVAPGQLTSTAFWPMLLAVVVATVAAAAVSYVVVERPALSLKDRRSHLFADWRPLGLPADALLLPPEPKEPEEPKAKRELRRPWLVPSAIVAVVVALPVYGLWIAPGPPMEEGFMLVFPERVLHGDIPNKDFLHLYGPGSLWLIAGFFEVFGVALWVERLVGLLQMLGIIVGITVVGYRWGRWTAAIGGSITAILIMPPIQFTALAWVGGAAFALWAVIVAARAFDPDHSGRRTLLYAGLLAGAALLFRPDLVLAMSLPFGAAVIWGLDWAKRRQLLAGLAIGVSPYLIHFATAGIGNSITGMVTEPIFKLRPGRRLPFPPRTDDLGSHLNEAFKWRNWPWPITAFGEPMQVFVWVLLLFAVCAALLAIAIKARRSGSPEGWRLLLLALLAIGILPQAVQRADTAHLAWVSCIPFGLLPAALSEWQRLRGSTDRARITWAVVPLAVMLFLIPHYTTRWYADYVGQTFGYRRDSATVNHRGRLFYYGDPVVADAADAMLADVDRLTEDGDRLVVGMGDLRRTSYSEAWIYYMLPQLTPGTYYIEMDPGVANTADSGLDEEIRDADVVVLATTYDNWDEPNTSPELGSNKPNLVLLDRFCVFKRYGQELRFQPDVGMVPTGRGIYEIYLPRTDNRCAEEDDPAQSES